MIRKFLDRLAGLSVAPAQDPEAEARLAAAALLVEVARSDGEYLDAEQRMIDRVLCEAYGLSSPDAAALRTRAEAAEAEAVDSFRFTRTLKETLTVEERAAFLEQLWRVVLADDRRDKAEDALMRRLAGLLYVPDQDSARARLRAAARDGH